MSPPLFVVAETPALLAGMPYPGPETDWAALHGRGFRRLVRLHAGNYDPAPLVAHDLALEDLYGGRAPTDPEAERERVWEAARLTAKLVARGEGVLVHCVGGTGLDRHRPRLRAAPARAAGRRGDRDRPLAAPALARVGLAGRCRPAHAGSTLRP